MFGFTRDGTGLLVARRHNRASGAFYTQFLSSAERVFPTADDNVQVFGRTRNGPPPPPETTTHPLLLDASSANRSTGSHPRGNRLPSRIVAAGSTELLQTIEELLSNGAVQLFQHIMTRGRGGGAQETIRVDVPAGTLMNIERGFRRAGAQSVRIDRAPRPPTNQLPVRDLDPLLTLQRWAEEVKILHGDFVTERAGKLANHVILALLPAAIEAAEEAKLREEEATRKRAEQEKAEAEAAEKARTEEEVQKAKIEKEAVQTSGASSEQSRIPETSEVSEDQTMDVPHPTDSDTEMIDGTIPASEPTPMSTSTSEDQVPAEPSSSDTGEAPSAPARVTVMIHGSEVDITDTGIDPTFLEALPDEMREEVLSQHFRDQRAAQIERPADSQISAEFLDALPPELRAEIIQQEAMERARRQVEESATTTGPAEIDPASFIASLDPNLRQAVLLDQDDGFLQTLPANILAEVAALQQGRGARMHVAGNTRRTTLPSSAPQRKPAIHHDAIQLLDKAGVAVLIRLLFFPQVLKKTLLFRVLVNLCENAKTRTELFNLLLNILQDGTGDLAAVDKSFAQMSVKNTKSPKAVGKQKSASDYFGLTLPNSQGETVPDLIAQRCLEALTYIVSANHLSSMFFLSEHEIPAGLRRVASKKGKGKEKQTPQTHYPIVLLLGLLDRQSLLRTPSIMESVVGLLATVTRPLTSLKDQKIIPAVPEASSSTQAPIASENLPQPTVPAAAPVSSQGMQCSFLQTSY